MMYPLAEIRSAVIDCQQMAHLEEVPMRVVRVPLLIGYLIAVTMICSAPRLVQAQSLQELFAGGSVTVGDKQFRDWSLTFQSATGTLPDYSQVRVAAINDNPLNGGLKFTGFNQLATSGTNVLTVEFEYTVTTANASPLINGNTLTLDSYSFGGAGGNILISGDVASASADDLGNTIAEADQSSGLFNTTSSISFSPQSSVRVSNALTLGGDNAGDTVDLSMFSQRFSQVPEPSGSVLVICGTLILAIRRRTSQAT
jgi:hypothetical protein